MTKENLKKTYITYRLFIFPAVVTLSSLILIVFVIFPQISALISDFQSEKEMKSKFEVMEVKAEALESIDEDDINNKLNLALRVYPSDYDYTSVVGVLQNVASKYSFAIMSLHLGGSSDSNKGKGGDFNVKIDLTGPKTLLSSLIEGIENSPRIMKVNSIQLSDDKAAGSVSVTLDIKVYYKVLPTDFGSAESSLPQLSEKDQTVLATLARLQTNTNTVAPTQANVPKGKTNPFE